MKVKAKRIFKRIGVLFALALVLVPLLALGVSAGFVIRDWSLDEAIDISDRPLLTDGKLNITNEQLGDLMYRVCGQSRFYPEYNHTWYLNLSFFMDNRGLGSLQDVTVVSGYEGAYRSQLAFGNSEVVLSRSHFRTFGDMFYNIGLGRAYWSFRLIDLFDSSMPMVLDENGFGNVFYTVRAGGQCDVTFFNTIRDDNLQNAERVQFFYEPVGGTLDVGDFTYVLDRVVVRDFLGNSTTYENVGNTRVLALSNIFTAFLDTVNVDYGFTQLLGGEDLYVERPFDIALGYLSGLDVGDYLGYTQGHREGVTDGENAVFESENMLWKFVVGLFDAPAVLIQSMTNFNLFGVNLFSLIQVIFGILVAILVVSIVIMIVTKFKT